MLIGVELLLPQGEEKTALCKVLRRSVDANGKTTGLYDSNQALNTLLYDVQFPDGAVKQYGANVIALNVLEQVESDGHYTVKLKRILDHCREGNAISKESKYVQTRDGQRIATVNSWVEVPCGVHRWEEAVDNAQGSQGIKSCGSC